jgi:hypothetical protein
MVPLLRVIYPDGITHFQQDYSPIHDSRVVQEWPSLLADVELFDWSPRAPDMNTIEYVECGKEDNAGNLACPSSQKQR